ncbi:MAG: ExbD/TolR family protein [Flavobacteriaceae bacterium]|jgi:biopolymer transport protein ExbD
MKIKGHHKPSAQFSLSSMTDVVFLLLVFFLLTSSVSSAIDLTLPEGKGNSTSEAQTIAISIDERLRYFIDETQINPEYLALELKKALDERPGATLLLRAEENVAIKEAVRVLDIANANNYKIVLAVAPK